MAAEQVAGLPRGHDEQRAVEIGKVIDASILRSVHRLKLFVGRPAAIDRGVVAGAGDAKACSAGPGPATGAAADGRTPPDVPCPSAIARDRRRSGA